MKPPQTVTIEVAPSTPGGQRQERHPIEQLLERALREWRDGLEDALITATAAVDAMRIEMGELPASKLADVLAYLDGEDEGEDDEDEGEPACTCPPDLAARGGFRGSCPAHG